MQKVRTIVRATTPDPGHRQAAASGQRPEVSVNPQVGLLWAWESATLRSQAYLNERHGYGEIQPQPLWRHLEAQVQKCC